MNERDRTTRQHSSTAHGDDRIEEHLRAAFAAAYPRVKPTESLSQRVAEATSRNDLRPVRTTFWRRPWSVKWSAAAAVVGAGVLLAICGLMRFGLPSGRPAVEAP